MGILLNLFLGCFIFGLVFTVASFLLSGLGHFGGTDGGVGHGGDIGAGHGGLHVDHGVHPGHADVAHGEVKANVLGWFNFNALIVFITWFGGAGFVLVSLGLNGWLAIPLALVGGIIGYVAVILFFSKVLYPSQTPFMNVSDYNLVGTVGRVSNTVYNNGTGEIIYTKFGTRRSAPARSVNGQTYQRDTQVVILRYENGIAYVDELDKLLADAGADKWLNANLAEGQKNSDTAQ